MWRRNQRLGNVVRRRISGDGDGVAAGDKGRSHVIAEERDIRDWRCAGDRGGGARAVRGDKIEIFGAETFFNAMPFNVIESSAPSVITVHDSAQLEQARHEAGYSHQQGSVASA
jgi:hypothetical protein